MNGTEQLFEHIHSISGMTRAEFDLSGSFWEHKTYKKYEFYNTYKNVCRHLAFVLGGVFRIYKYHESAGAEKNIMFFSPRQFMSSFKSFLTQTPCEYYTESMTESEVLYIHHSKLQHLYRISSAWEHFGRVFAEAALNAVMSSTESLLFKTPEERYLELAETYPQLIDALPLYHIASYLGIEAPSLSRIRRRVARKSRY